MATTDLAGQASLTILATSDLHLNLPDDPQSRLGPPSPQGRTLVEVLACLQRLRAEDPQALLVDNGDVLQGAGLGEALSQAAAEDADFSHPMIQAMNRMGYDALSLGNHDFDYGLDFLRRAIGQARFKVLCANLMTEGDGAALFPATALLSRRLLPGPGGEIRIGLIGLLPQEVTVWNADQLEGLARAGDLVEVAGREAARLRAAGADLVVALCHSGIGADLSGFDGERAADRVAMLPGIDAVVAGHAHQLFPGPDFAAHPQADLLNGRIGATPVVMPGMGGSHIGRLRLRLQRRAAGGWRLCGGEATLIPVPALPATAPPPPELAPILSRSRGRTDSIMARAAGSAAVPIHSLFALAADCPATRLLAEAKRWHVTAALRGGPFADLPVLAAATAARVGGRGGPGNFTHLPAGALRARHLAELCPFPNTIRALRITGAGLREWLEHSAGTFNRVGGQSRDVPLVHPQRPGYGFDVILGLTYQIDLAAPARYDPQGRLLDPGARRIEDLRHAGRPVAPEDVFALAVSSHRASGSGGYPGSGSQREEIYRAPLQIRQIVADYLAAHPDWQPGPQPIWRFAPHPGASAVVQTAPQARQHLPHPGLEPLCLDASGFLELRVVF